MAPKIDPKVGYFGSTQKATLNKDFDNYSIPVTRIFRIHHPNRIFILSKKYTLITYFLFSLKKHTLFLDFCCFWHPKHSLLLSVKNYPFPCFCIRAWYPHWIQVCPPPRHSTQFKVMAPPCVNLNCSNNGPNPKPVFADGIWVSFSVVLNFLL